MDPAPRGTTVLTWCDGAGLRRYFSGGLAVLRRCAVAVDRLNVFPVPDGDTGTNLVATVESAVRAADEWPGNALAPVAHRCALGAALGARGNSGVIFAQMCVGLAEGFDDAARVDASGWARGWETAAHRAYESVSSPVEGTILTVIAAAAAAATEAARSVPELQRVWQAMVDAADQAVAQSTGMLPVLARAGVVDAGGLGLALFLRGGLSSVTRVRLPDPAELLAPGQEALHVIAEATFPRYCTQFVLRGCAIGHRRELEALLTTLGDSVDLGWLKGADGDSLLQVHVHTENPEGAVCGAQAFGVVSDVRVEDMRRQRSRLLSAETAQPEAAVVAVVSGSGMQRLFESFHGVGAAVDVEPGDPAIAAELRTALVHLPARSVVILPNDTRLLAAAQSVAADCGKPAVVVPTGTLPEGVAAALAFSEEASLSDNARAMTEAARGVRTVTVTWARDPSPPGAGAPGGRRAFARHAGDVLAQGADLLTVVGAAIVALGGEIGLLTLYCGPDVSRTQAEELARSLELRIPDVETEIVEAVQQEWPLVIGVEGNGRPGGD